MTRQKNSVRIISGKWRGRKIHFSDVPGLRPTTDRMRETVFNKLRNNLPNARCLDLFAGSGALGLEALSRGASHVTFVDQSPQVIKELEKIVETLEAKEQTDIYRLNVPKMNPPFSGKFDIVFLDPPYNQNLIEPTKKWLIKHQLIDSNSLLFIEKDTEFWFETIDPTISK